MPRHWFKHGKWPKFLVGLHYYTIASFLLLLATGLALYLPAVHAPLIPYLSTIYRLHILFGIVFAISLFTPLSRRLPVQKPLTRVDWWMPMAFGSAIVVTGILLWQVTWFPTTWRSTAFWWHGNLSYWLGVWLIVHAVCKAFGIRPSDWRWAGRVQPDRRMFLRWLGLGSAGAFILAVFDPFASLARLLAPRGSSTVGGGSAFAAFYTVTGSYPALTLDTYRLEVGGDVANAFALTWHDLLRLPPHRVKADFHCVTGWSVPNVSWVGVHLESLYKKARPSADVRFVHFYSADGAYTECLSLKEALAASVVLAYQLNGAALTRQQGFPLRLVVPNMYGYKSIKWINRIAFSREPITGYWEQRGYSTEAYIE